jgi:hypothetical protein
MDTARQTVTRGLTATSCMLSSDHLLSVVPIVVPLTLVSSYAFLEENISYRRQFLVEGSAASICLFEALPLLKIFPGLFLR